MVGELKASPGIDAAKLGEYVACSVPLHLADGWSYMSRAFDAVSRGDRYSAYHLAYYAELRAAISLLAAEGIGVFNTRHVALNSRLDATDFKRSTHEATWLLLSAWSSEPGRAVRLLDSISIESRTLSEWLEAVGVVEPARQIVAQDWLHAWSIDLKILSGDSGRRNEMSYRPTRIKAPAPPPVDPESELVAPLFNAWMTLEPSSTDKGGAALDASLLRESISLAVAKGLCNYRTLGAAVSSLQGSVSAPLYQTLSAGVPSALAIFREAKIENIRGRAATPILARALLLLRLASAAAASLLAAAAISKSDLEFWWEALGIDLGLWTAGNDVDVFSDLWADVSEAIDEASDEVASISGPPSVLAVSGILCSKTPLTQFSRAPLWLLALD